ncbi:PIG-L deacetylase family protein [Paenisporosarcina sp. OV554]|uniref:PIG-L deacetylase family protein n=1 Tax=Paenisporosarcina sp. OV554 TaxID=2135694 RepID=UPI000D4FD456|nr:PIG-L family deacetylase [Paenisporosarcina sp. OV554]PUB17846.1 LmbE family N-acetylglucosaminyl deacetylase [Paenisporosarcina sp. OV554]
MKQLLIKAINPLAIPLTKIILKRFYSGNLPITQLEHKQNVVVFAPHVDDETIGLGGTIKKYTDQQTKVHVVNVTDGGKSNRHVNNLSEIRKQELKLIQPILGISSLTFLDYPDGQVNQIKSSEDFIKVLEELKPDIVYTTSFIDAHTDHTATAHLLADALTKSQHQPQVVRQYEINCPVPPEFINCVIDITNENNTKLQAITYFKSQIIAFDGFILLSKLKSSIVSKKLSKVETFIESTVDEFIKQSDLLLSKNLVDFSQDFKQANRSSTLLIAVFKNLDKKREIYKQLQNLS